MIFPRARQVLAALLLSILLFTTACTQAPPSRFDSAQKESSQQKSGQAVAKSATQGAEFNKLFPSAQAGYDRVFTQEKKGFAAANLKKDGKVVAELAISDTTSVPGAAAKYANSTKQIAGYPSTQVGNTQTSILVNNRYQVKVISKDPSFTAQDREQWISKFNLSGLAKIK